MTTEQREMRVLTVVTPNSELYWKEVFDKYDTDHDGRISYWELKEIIKSNRYQKELPVKMVEDIMKHSDTDKSGYLEFDEFVNMILNPDFKSVFGHFVETYIRIMIPPGRHVQISGRTYEEQYSFWPPTLVMIVISLVEILLFGCDAAFGYFYANGIVANWFIYENSKRKEVWRFVTYMLVHSGFMHLLSNLLIQLFVGYPLEVVHRWWRVIIIYLAGVAAGSLVASLIEPQAIIFGASGGVFALSSAHAATIIINWKEMNIYSVVIQLLVFVLLTALMFIEKVSLTVHLAGAVAGLLVGIGVLRNLSQKKWEKQLWWCMVGIYVTLMLAGILAHIFLRHLGEEEDEE